MARVRRTRTRSCNYDENRFERLYKERVIWYDAEAREWVGRAEDGTEVALGISADDAKGYVNEFGGPDKW